MPRFRGSRVVAVVVTLVTVVFIAVPVATLLAGRTHAASHIAGGVRATAYVEGSRRLHSSETQVAVWFRPAAEADLVHAIVSVSGRHSYDGAQSLPIRYDPKHPTRAEYAPQGHVAWRTFAYELAALLFLVSLTGWAWIADRTAASNGAAATAAAS